jgi:hypothetical protein
MSIPKYFEAIENHLDKYFQADDEIIVFDEKCSPDFHLDVYWIKPNVYRDYTLLMTNGISSTALNVPDESIPRYIELCILLPKEWKLENEDWKKPENYWPIELLKAIGPYPFHHNTWLGFGHTIPEHNHIIGTNFTATIVLKSKRLPAEFQQIDYGDTTIELYTLFPLFHEELEYKKEKGTHELLKLFDKEDIDDVININRKNVCITI